MSLRKRKIAFVDRDGTIIEEPPDEQVDRLDKIRFLPDVIPSMLRLRDAGFEFVMVTNQDGLGTSSFPTPDFETPQRFVLDALATQGITFAAVHVDPTTPEERAETRKPGIGMVRGYLSGGDLDFDQSVVIGDRDSDILLAKNMGLKAYRIAAANAPQDQTDARTWPEIVGDILNRPRTAIIERSTRETKISGRVALEETGTSISTGIGFFDHMLDQIAVHAGFRLELSCDGDLGIDEHHTIEDCGLALGDALSGALSDRRGIGRFGFVLPMDEAQATLAVDLGGRPYLRFDAAFPRDSVGGMPTEMVEHFFRSLAQTLGATIHITVAGHNTHHMVEAIFKGFGRAMRPALARDASSTAVPSSKGVLV
jgi:imidazoleglycerol-phosphate dehydratase/histidinol-phosphatase